MELTLWQRWSRGREEGIGGGGIGSTPLHSTPPATTTTSNHPPSLNMSVREEIRLFEAPEHAKLYVESRPLPPDSLITKILNFLDNVLININLVKVPPPSIYVVQFLPACAFHGPLFSFFLNVEKKCHLANLPPSLSALSQDDGAAHVRRSLAVDVGCGSGQATSLLAPHFSAVRAFDVSAAQVAQAVDRKRRRKEEEEEEGGRRSMDNVEFQ